MSWRALLVAAACGGASTAAHVRLSGLPSPPALEALPAPAAVRLLSLGNAPLAADVAYLRAVASFGDRDQHAVQYPRLAAHLQQSVALDANFAAPYLLAATGLLFARPHDPAGPALVRQGAVHHPHLWQLPLARGLHAYDQAHDYAEAAEAFAAAARTPGAPAFLAPLAARVAARTESPQTGLALVDAMLEVVEDDATRATLLSRRPLLQLEARLARLDVASRAYRAALGRPPRDIEALAAFVAERGEADGASYDEPFAACARDPLGGALALDALGRAATVHEAQRLQLHGAGLGETQGRAGAEVQPATPDAATPPPAAAAAASPRSLP